MRLSTCRVNVTGEGVELNDGLNKPACLVVNDTLSKNMWQADLTDWSMWCVECERRVLQEEKERVMRQVSQAPTMPPSAASLKNVRS